MKSGAYIIISRKVWAGPWLNNGFIKIYNGSRRVITISELNRAKWVSRMLLPHPSHVFLPGAEKPKNRMSSSFLPSTSSWELEIGRWLKVSLENMLLLSLTANKKGNGMDSAKYALQTLESKRHSINMFPRFSTI